MRLTVEDNGIGIPHGHERRIFEAFYRAPRVDRPDVQGFGLGLSYVARVVAGHGGAVRARNISGGGCPDIPYLHAKMADRPLTELPRPRDVGRTLCALMLDRAFVQSLEIWSKANLK